MNEMPVVMCSKALWHLNCHLRLCCLKNGRLNTKKEGCSQGMYLVQETSNYYPCSWHQRKVCTLHIERCSTEDSSLLGWFCVARHEVPNIWKDCSTFMIRVKQSKKNAWPWRLRHSNPARCHDLLTHLYSVTS